MSEPSKDGEMTALMLIANDVQSIADAIYSQNTWGQNAWRSRQLDAIVRKLRALQQPRTQWQPIASAPKDGKRILYATTIWVTEGRWTEHGWFQVNADYSDAWSSADYPTHWQPIPDPPEVHE